MKRSRQKVIMIIMAAALSAFHVGNAGAAAVSGTVEDAQQKKEQLQDNLKDAQKLIDQLKSSEGDIEEAVEELDKKLTSISEQITDLEDQSEDKSKEIRKTKKALKSAKSDEKVQYENMKLRIRYMYEHSGMTYLEALITAQSFGDFLNQVEYISQIMSYDREKLEEYQKTQELIANSEQILKKDKEELKQMQAQLEEEQKAVDLLLKEKESQLSAVKSDLGDAQSEAEQYKAKIAAENDIINQILAAEKKAKEEEEARKKAEEAKKAEAEKETQGDGKADKDKDGTEEEVSKKPDSSESGNTSSNVNTSNSYTGGTFTWPCPSSSRITSSFGYRGQPTAGASTYHQGIDIGASYGAAIVAAADGVVTSTGYSNALGNYVILSHGGGLFTVYFHCSSILVSTGKTVSRGSTIAKVGSTGISTGNHLHFGVQLNGKYVNPMNYL